jgi:hypothetical protein
MPRKTITRDCLYCGKPFTTEQPKIRHCSRSCGRLGRVERDAEAVVERFWDRVQKGDGCWEWVGSRQSQGYGRHYLRGKMIPAHRFSWELHFGPIPDDLWVLHTCDNPPCCNPDHMFLGYPIDNIEDMVNKGRQAKGETHAWHVRPEAHAHGEGHGLAKLSDAIVRDARIRFRDGATVAALAKEHGVAPPVMHRAIRGQTWKHVT